jgi:hypothetical protein
MLLLLLCGVEKETVVNEYMMSSRTMAAWNDNGNDDLSPHLQTEQVLSVEREYMQVCLKTVHSCKFTAPVL